jgi:16S rRNA (uracil1498-N3)-methyltransferase
MHRFFISPDQLRGRVVRFDEVQAHQMRRVLRLRAGARVLALDGEGLQYEVQLEEVSNSHVTGLVVAKTPATGEPRVRLTLFQSLLQRDKFEWVLQKGTEIGVAAFVPVITRRSLVREGDVGENKLERWRRIIKEAAEQSGRGRLPAISAAVTLETALAGLPSPQPSPEGRGGAPSPQPSPEGRGGAPSSQPSPEGRGGAPSPQPSPEGRGGLVPSPSGGGLGRGSFALLAWEGETARTLRQAVGQTSGVTDIVTDIALFIGPEGGYETAEVEAAAAHGVAAFTLGRRILRTETAAVVGAALVLYELGEMGPLDE